MYPLGEVDLATSKLIPCLPRGNASERIVAIALPVPAKVHVKEPVGIYSVHDPSVTIELASTPIHPTDVDGEARFKLFFQKTLNGTHPKDRGR